MVQSIAMLAAALQAGTPINIGKVPLDIIRSFVVAAIELEFVGNCLERYPNRQHAARHRSIKARYDWNAERAERIWGVVESGTEDTEPEAPVTCASTKVSAALDNAKAHIDGVERQIAVTTAPLRHGVWAGELKLCRNTIERAVIDRDEFYRDPALQLTLSDVGRTAFTALTSRAIGTRLAVTVDGAIVFEPFIAEPHTSDTIQIAFRDPQKLARTMTLITSDC